MFGGVRLDLNDFLLAYKSYFYYMLQTTAKTLFTLRVPIEARAAVHENQVTFQQIVRWGRDCNASKPLDRIYSLLGLLARCRGGTKSLPPALSGTIDYTRDLREIYWDIAFTRPFSIDPSTIDENDRMEVIERWVDLLPAIGQVLPCPFTPDSLRYADCDRATPLCKDKARLTRFFVDICRQAVIDDRSLLELSDDFSRKFGRPWPTKRCARRLWSDPSRNLQSLGTRLQFQRLLGSLLIETAKSRDIDEEDVYQATIISLKMSTMQPREGE